MQIQDFYVTLVECSDAAVVAKDVNGMVLIWNKAAERLLGYSEQEMKGRSVQALLPPHRLDEDESVLARIREGERVSPFLTQRRHKDGRLVDLAIGASPMRDGRGEIIGVSYIARDATAFVEQQRLLHESEQRFLGLANQMPQLAWIMDARGTMEWCNNRWVEYTGIPRDDMGPSAWREVVHPDQFAQVVETFYWTVEEGTEWEDTFQIRRHDGEYRWFLSRAQPVKDQGGKIIRWIGTNTDITDVREREQQIRLLLMEVNHRSKNMLATIQALARRSAPDNPEFVARFSERVRSLAINQDILVRREWREVPLQELVAGQLTFVKEALGEVVIHGVDCSLTPQAAEVVGMALHELATNSLKYGALSAKGGHVDVGWECSPDGRVFAIWWRESGGPPVEAPTRKGFGTTLIQDVPRHNLGAEVALEYRTEGVCWSLRSEGRSPPIYTIHR